MGRLRDVAAAAFGRRAAGPAPGTTAAALRSGVTVGTSLPMQLSVDAEARGWTHSAVAYRCVDLLSANAASVDLAVYAPDGTRIVGHWVDLLFNRRPNPDMSARVFKTIMYGQLELSGRHWAFLDRGDQLDAPAAIPYGVYPLFERVETIVADRPDGTPRPAAIIGYVLHRSDGIRVPMLPDEVLSLRYPHPFRPYEALAPWRAATHAVDLDAYAREWQRSALENGGQPGGVVYLGEMDEQAFAAAKASFRSTVEGARNARKHLLVASRPGGAGGGISYERLGLTAEEVDYLETRVANSDEIMLAFGVPKDLLVGGATYENKQQAKAYLWSDTLKPKLELLASEVDRLLLPSDSEQAAFDLSGVEALQESQDAVAGRVRENMYTDVYTIDEGRSAVGLPPLPGNLGQMTLTPYRAQFGVAPGGAAGASGTASADLSALLARLQAERDEGAVSIGALHRALAWAEQAALARPVAQLVQPAPAPVARATGAPVDLRKGPTVATANVDYDELEAAGRAAVRRLSNEQRERVLRDFDRLMAKPNRSAEWLAAVRREARAIADSGALQLAIPDPDTAPAHAMTGLELAAGPDGWEERIGIRDLFDGAYWRRRTGELLRPMVERAWRKGGAAVADDEPDTDDPGVSKELDARVADLAGRVTATTEAVLRSRVLAAGIAEGESVPQLRARLQSVFADLSDYRATMIARTETVGAYNAASHRAAVDAGATRKRWMATDDARTRATHRAASGTTAPIDGRFTASGCRWPGDPTAPASQTVNCRCVLTYTFDTTTED